MARILKATVYPERKSYSRALLFSSLLFFSIVMSGCGDQGQFRLVFEDNFEGSELDDSNWVECYWWTIDGCTNAGNNELEWYLPENVSISDGKLVLEAREEPFTNSKGASFPYTSGMVTTGRNVSDLSIDPKFSFQYGMVEARIKMPEGSGLWPAIWLLPITHESRPEIDIIEVLGHETNLARYHIHYHDRRGNRESMGETLVVPDMAGEWQTVGLLWEPDQIIWYLNGVEMWRVDEPQAIPHEPMYLILNLAVGGDYPGPPDDQTHFPSQVEIEYVRIWQ